MLSERSQTQRTMYYTVPPTRKVQTRQIYRERTDRWMPGAGSGSRDGTREVFGVIEMLTNWIVVIIHNSILTKITELYA